MGRNKALDDKLFNCSQDYEHDQVASHYGIHKDRVLKFLKDSCASGAIKRSTHMEVYRLIQAKLGYPIPV